jgi:hypothetical protein
VRLGLVRLSGATALLLLLTTEGEEAAGLGP